jgi:hypothetical protein
MTRQNNPKIEIPLSVAYFGIIDRSALREYPVAVVI